MSKKSCPLPCECPVAGYCERHKMEKSKAKHRLCQNDKAYREMWDKLARGELVSPPGIVTKAVRLKSAIDVWQEAGKPLRPDTEVTEIFATHCRPCQHFSGNDRSGTCGLCGCQLHSIGGLLNKIRMATEECPIGKWGAEPKAS